MILPDYTLEEEFSSDADAVLSALEDMVKMMKK